MKKLITFFFMTLTAVSTLVGQIEDPTDQYTCPGTDATFTIKKIFCMNCTIRLQEKINNVGNWVDLVDNQNTIIYNSSFDNLSVTLKSINFNSKFRFFINYPGSNDFFGYVPPSSYISKEVGVYNYPKPTLLSPPVDSKICSNTAAFSTSASSVTNVVNYQWQRLVNSSWSDLPNQTNSTLTINTISAADHDSPFRCVITDKCKAPETTTITPEARVKILFFPPLLDNTKDITLCIRDASLVLSDKVLVKGGTWSEVSGSGLSVSNQSAVYIQTESNLTSLTPNVVKYTVSKEGCTAEERVNIYVKENKDVPTITKTPGLVCPGTSIDLTAFSNVPGIYTYDWRILGNNVTLSTDYIYKHKITGNEIVTLRSVNSFGCKSVSVEIPMISPFGYHVVNADKTTIDVGEKVAFTYSSNAAVSNTYSWNFDDGSLESREKNPVHSFYKPGEFLVTVKVMANSIACEGSSSIAINVKGNPISLPTGNLSTGFEGIEIYPNPVVDQVLISWGKPISSVKVFNRMGTVVYSGMALGKGEHRLDASTWASGLYHVQVASGTRIETKRIIVQH